MIRISTITYWIPYRMKILVLLSLISLFQNIHGAGKCSRPIVKRKRVYIYRNMPTVEVKVLRCLFNGSGDAYSDISSNCISTFKTGVFLDKFDQRFNIKQNNAPIVLEEYITEADPLKNYIFLRSGTRCRYDRGFCFDPRETPSYGAVWNVVTLPTEQCPNTLVPIFNGYVDIWNFSPENKNYVFYYVLNTDRAFVLKLTNLSRCHNEDVWFTEEIGYVVSLKSIGKAIKPTLKINEKFFPTLQSKTVVSESILKDCDIKTHSLDFDKQILADYLTDSENLKTVLKLYQNDINANKKTLEAFEGRTKRIETHFNSQGDLIKKSFYNINNTISALTNKLKELSKKNDELEYLIENFDFSGLNSNPTDLEKKVDNLENSLKQLEKTSNNFKKDLTNLQHKLDQQFVDIYQNVSNMVTLKISSLYPLIEKNKNELKILVNSIGVESKKCCNNFDIFKLDIKKALTSLENQIDKNISTKNTLNEYDERFRNFFQHNDNKYNFFIDEINNRLNEYVGGEEILINDLNISISMLRKDFNKIRNINNDLKNINDSLQTRLNSCEGTTQDLNVAINTIKNDIDKNNKFLMSNFKDIEQDLNKYKRSTDLQISDIVNNLSKLHNITNDSVSKLNTTISSKNKGFDCKTELNNIQNNFSKLLDDTTQSIINNFTNENDSIIKSINGLNTSLAGKIESTENELHNLENNLKECKTFVVPNIKENSIKIEKVKADLTDTVVKVNSLEKSLYNDLLKQFNSLIDSFSHKCKSCDEKINNFVSDINKKISDITNYVNRDENSLNELIGLKDITLNRINNSETKIHDLEETLKQHKSNIDTENSNLNNITKHLEATYNITINNENSITFFEKQLDKLAKKVNHVETLNLNSGQDYSRLVNNSLKLLGDELKIVNLQINKCNAAQTNFTRDWNDLSHATTTIVKNVNALTNRVEIVEKLGNEINIIKVDLDNNQQHFKKNDKMIVELRDNLTSCQNQQAKNEANIQDLIDEIDEIKNVYQKNEDLFANSLLNIRKQLDKKNNETNEIKKELEELTKCCKGNKQLLKAKDDEINRLKEDFKNTVEKLKNEHKIFNDLFAQILPGYVPV